MKVIDLINNSKGTAFSFEILPPLKGTGIEKLYQTIDTLREFDPKYINITTHRSEYVYKDLGNGLFQRNRLRRRPGTVAVAAAIQNKYNITVVPHILCSGFTREETEYVLLDLQFLNITDLLVLRGDKAKHESVFTPEGDGYHHAIELQEQINNFNKGIFVDGSEMKVTASPFSYGVACYPEKHEESPNIETDLYWLKKKVETGAEYAVTQLFYDNKKYFDFVEQAKAAGINIPIIPGIKPFKKISQLSMIPKTFKRDVIGQEEIKQRLIQEVNEGRIPHAQLICGPEGVGKMPLAIAYARYISCTNRGEEDACGVCPSCVKFNKLVHPDVHFVFPIVKSAKGKKEVCDDYIADWRLFVINNPYFNLNHWLGEMDAENSQALIYAKESDEILKKLSLKSSEGGFKITIVWLPEKMHPVCANKLLKLLEEPPEKTIFLLVSEAPDMILPTILSRTQRMNVRKIDEASIDRVLQSKYHVQPADSISIAHLANGNFVKALETIHLNEENQLFFELFVNLMRLSYQRKIKEMKMWSEQVASMGRERQKNFLEYCQRMIRENFVFNLHQRNLTYMTINEQNFATRFAPFVNERNVMGIMDELSEAQLHIEQNVNAKMVFFDFSLKMIVLLKQ